MKYRIGFLSANIFGYEILKDMLGWVKDIGIVIYTLHPDARTVMYDGVDTEKWLSFEEDVEKIVYINHIYRDDKDRKKITSENLDLLISAGWRQLIPEEVLYSPTRGTVGFHPSLLPHGRGPAPLINTILLGLKQTGLTLYYMDKNLDSGDIIAQKVIPIGKDEYVTDLYGKIIEKGKELLRENLYAILEGTSARVPQRDSEATVYPKINPSVNEIRIDTDGLDMANRKIRAFSHPYLGAYIRYGDYKIVIYRGYFEKKPSSIPTGRIIDEDWLDSLSNDTSINDMYMTLGDIILYIQEGYIKKEEKILS